MQNYNDEPLLNGEDDRATLFPINPKYKEIFALYKQHVASFWTPEEVKSFDKDIQDFRKLSEAERQQVIYVLSFFASKRLGCT